MWPERLILCPLPFPPHRTSPRKVERPGLSLCSSFLGMSYSRCHCLLGLGKPSSLPGLPDSVPQGSCPHRPIWSLGSSLGPGCSPASQAHQVLGLPGSPPGALHLPCLAASRLVPSVPPPLCHSWRSSFCLCVRAMRVLPFPQHCLSGSVALPAALGSDCGKPGVNLVLPRVC